MEDWRPHDPHNNPQSRNRSQQHTQSIKHCIQDLNLSTTVRGKHSHHRVFTHSLYLHCIMAHINPYPLLHLLSMCVIIIIEFPKISVALCSMYSETEFPMQRFALCVAQCTCLTHSPVNIYQRIIRLLSL